MPVATAPPKEETEIEIRNIISSLPPKAEKARRKLKKINIIQMARDERISAKEIIGVYHKPDESKYNMAPMKISAEDKEELKELQQIFAKWYGTFPQRKPGENRTEHRRKVDEKIKMSSREIGETAEFRQCIQNILANPSEPVRCMAIKLLSRAYPK